MMTLQYNSFRISCLLVTCFLLQSCSVTEQNTNVQLKIADGLEKVNNYPEAEKIYLDLLAANVTNQPPYFFKLAALMSLANCYIRDKNYSAAINYCHDALRVCDKVYGPNDNLKTRILFLLGSAYQGLKQYNNAESIYNKIIFQFMQPPDQSNAKIFLPLIKLGDLAFEQDHLPLAIKYYEEASALKRSFGIPFDHLMDYRLALAYMKVHDNKKCEMYFRKCLPSSSPLDSVFTPIVDTYIDFLKRNNRMTEASALESSLKRRALGDKKFTKWLSRLQSAESKGSLVSRITTEELMTLTSWSQVP